MRRSAFQLLILRALTIGIAFYCIGELTFRIPGTYQLIEYSFDPELGHVYRPNQTGVMFLGNFSVRTPPISINDSGFRGPVHDPQKRTVMLIGSSEVFGPGLRDTEIISSRLEEKLRERSDIYQVLNLAIGGHGPFHHSVIAQRFAHLYDAETVIVRASTSDRFFLQPSDERLRELRRQRLRNDLVARISRFAPFLYNKIEAQIKAIRLSFQTEIWTSPQEITHEMPQAELERTEIGEEMWITQRIYWRSIMALSDRFQFRLLFYVPNPRSAPSETALAKALREEAKAFDCVTVIEIGSSHFDAPQMDSVTAEKWFKDTYTLGYDPHGNALQHEILSRVLFGAIVDSMGNKDSKPCETTF